MPLVPLARQLGCHCLPKPELDRRILEEGGLKNALYD